MLKISQNSRENTSGAGVFLWILWNFQGHLFYRTPPDHCFWNGRKNLNRFVKPASLFKTDDCEALHWQFSFWHFWRRNYCSQNLWSDNNITSNILLSIFLFILTHFGPMFHFYIPWKGKKEVFWRFQGLGKQSIGLKQYKYQVEL